MISSESYRYPPLPNDHFENFLIRYMNSNCPRPLRAIKYIAHALIYVLNSPFSTWYIECMPQSHGHHQARYNLCHIPTPRKSSESWTSVFQIPRACKYCSKMLRNPPAKWFMKIIPMKTRNEKKTLMNMFSNDVYYRKIFWFRCCLRTKYSGIFSISFHNSMISSESYRYPPPSKAEKRRQGGYL